jgi:hypothetical protein
MRLRGGLAGIAVVWLLAASAPAALAADTCSDWFHLAGSHQDTNLYDTRARDECVRIVTSQASRAGFKYSVNIDTISFWFDSDVVVARCMTRTLVTLFAYDYRNAACSLLNQIRNSLR